MTLTTAQQLARERVCLPLDGLHSMDAIHERVEELSPYVGLFKIGKETFTRFGPEAVRLVHGYGSDVFLDLKYHDIPNTVRGACRAAAELGVRIINVHAMGGLDMMRAAVEGVNEGSEDTPPSVIAVTILTSIDESIMHDDLRVSGSLEDQVLHLAQLASQAGMDGIVCSAQDLTHIRGELPESFMFVTPGIKGPNTAAGKDQKRVMTPSNAVRDGSSILVIGRAITGHATADERLKAAKDVLDDIASVSS